MPTHGTTPAVLGICFLAAIFAGAQPARGAAAPSGHGAGHRAVRFACHAVPNGRQLPPPGRTWWSYWIKEGVARPPAGVPVAQTVCLPLALDQWASLTTNEPPHGLVARATYHGSGYTVTITTTQCFSAAGCRSLGQRGRLEVLAGGRRVWVSERAAGPARTTLRWNTSRLVIRLTTNLSQWWAERVAEHVRLVR